MGLKRGCLWLKVINTVKSRGELTDGRRGSIKPSSSVRATEGKLGGGKWKSSRRSLGSFITVSGATTPVDIPIDEPVLWRTLACGAAARAQDSFVPLMKIFQMFHQSLRLLYIAVNVVIVLFMRSMLAAPSWPQRSMETKEEVGKVWKPGFKPNNRGPTLDTKPLFSTFSRHHDRCGTRATRRDQAAAAAAPDRKAEAEQTRARRPGG